MSSPLLFYLPQFMQDATNQLYVGGLTTDVTDADLAEIFGEYGVITHARVITDRDTGESRGFGFVTFETVDQASAAKDTLDGAEVNDSVIAIDFARPRPERTERRERRAPDGEENKCKLFLGNVSWDLTADDIRGAFESFGELQDVHVPRDQDGRARGFAFVLYTTEEAAAAAKEQMDGAELDGRNLSITFAIERSS